MSEIQQAASSDTPRPGSDRSRLRSKAVSLERGGRRVVDEVSVSLASGAWTSIVGPNGAGKSSLLSMLAGLQLPDGGQLWLDDRELSDWPSRERARRIAWLAQQSEADGDLSGEDVVSLGRIPHHGLLGTPDAKDVDAIRAAMRETECELFSRRRLGELSGGERQRVLLARALAVESPVILLDEPTAHLDAPHQSALVRSVARRAANGCSVAVILHDLTLALSADRIWLMAEGRLLVDSTPDDTDLHGALIDVFQGSIAIERIESDEGVQFLVRPRI